MHPHPPTKGRSSIPMQQERTGGEIVLNKTQTLENSLAQQQQKRGRVVLPLLIPRYEFAAEKELKSFGSSFPPPTKQPRASPGTRRPSNSVQRVCWPEPAEARVSRAEKAPPAAFPSARLPPARDFPLSRRLRREAVASPLCRGRAAEQTPHGKPRPRREPYMANRPSG